MLSPRDCNKNSKEMSSSTKEKMISEKKDKKRRIQLYNFNELPEWQRNNNNKYITDGYLLETNSYLKCFNSLIYWNNQSINIYLNMFASIVYLFMLIFFTDAFLIPSFPSTTMTDYIIMNLFLATAFQTAIYNTAYHCFKIHSLSQAGLWGKINNLGIINHLTCSTITLLYYSFYDNVFYFKLLTLFTFLLTLCMTTVILTDTFTQSKAHLLRGPIFLLFGSMLTFLPLSIGIVKFGTNQVAKRIDLDYLTIELVLYFIAAMMYTFKLPERFNLPYYFNSYNLFHICFILASFCHLKLLINSFILMRTGINKPTLVSFK